MKVAIDIVIWIHVCSSYLEGAEDDTCFSRIYPKHDYKIIIFSSSATLPVYGYLHQPSYSYKMLQEKNSFGPGTW